MAHEPEVSLGSIKAKILDDVRRQSPIALALLLIIWLLFQNLTEARKSYEELTARSITVIMENTKALTVLTEQLRIKR